MDLYSYLKKSLERRDPYPAIDHSLRAELHTDGRISFYIHPERRDGDTPSFWVSDAGVFPKVEPMSKQAEFLTHPKEVRDAKLAAMGAEETAYPEALEDLLHRVPASRRDEVARVIAPFRGRLAGCYTQDNACEFYVADDGGKHRPALVAALKAIGIDANYVGFTDIDYVYRPQLLA